MTMLHVFVEIELKDGTLADKIQFQMVGRDLSCLNSAEDILLTPFSLWNP